MACPKEKEVKKTSTFGKVMKVLGLLALAAGTGVAIYDHRNQIVSGAQKAGSWTKTTFTNLKSKCGK